MKAEMRSKGDIRIDCENEEEFNTIPIPKNTLDSGNTYKTISIGDWEITFWSPRIWSPRK